MSIEETLDRLASNIALLTGAVATLAESVNGKYAGKPIYALQDTVQSASPLNTPPSTPPPTAAVPAPRKPRTPKPTPAAAAANGESVPAAAGSAPNTGPAPGAVQPAAPTKAAATPEPTLDDVRNALVQCQTRSGGKKAPQDILNKYSPSKTTGGLPQDKYATVITECAAA
jgi:hypothetical protein